jgi:hypothetical protein
MIRIRIRKKKHSGSTTLIQKQNDTQKQRIRKIYDLLYVLKSLMFLRHFFRFRSPLQWSNKISENTAYFVEILFSFKTLTSSIFGQKLGSVFGFGYIKN